MMTWITRGGVIPQNSAGIVLADFMKIARVLDWITTPVILPIPGFGSLQEKAGGRDQNREGPTPRQSAFAPPSKNSREQHPSGRANSPPRQYFARTKPSRIHIPGPGMWRSAFSSPVAYPGHGRGQAHAPLDTSRLGAGKAQPPPPWCVLYQGSTAP